MQMRARTIAGVLGVGLLCLWGARVMGESPTPDKADAVKKPKKLKAKAVTGEKEHAGSAIDLGTPKAINNAKPVDPLEAATRGFGGDRSPFPKEGQDDGTDLAWRQSDDGKSTVLTVVGSRFSDVRISVGGEMRALHAGESLPITQAQFLEALEASGVQPGRAPSSH